MGLRKSSPANIPNVLDLDSNVPPNFRAIPLASELMSFGVNFIPSAWLDGELLLPAFVLLPGSPMLSGWLPVFVVPDVDTEPFDTLSVPPPTLAKLIAPPLLLAVPSLLDTRLPVDGVPLTLTLSPSSSASICSTQSEGLSTEQLIYPVGSVPAIGLFIR